VKPGRQDEREKKGEFPEERAAQPLKSSDRSHLAATPGEREQIASSMKFRR
jgi:hypothetical protein